MVVMLNVRLLGQACLVSSLGIVEVAVETSIVSPAGGGCLMSTLNLFYAINYVIRG